MSSTTTAPSASTPLSTSTLLSTFLTCIEEDILPLTQKGVAEGNKVFGAAIMSKDNLRPIMLATNNEARCPLWHGETNCIKKFYEEIPSDSRPLAKECLFLTTHEPCSLCISAITWGGFDNFTYLFTYEDTRDAFSIPYDIDILESVYQVPAAGESKTMPNQRELYNRDNKFFKSQSIAQLLSAVTDRTRRAQFEEQVERIKQQYGRLAEEYAQGKGQKGIPLA